MFFHYLIESISFIKNSKFIYFKIIFKFFLLVFFKNYTPIQSISLLNKSASFLSIDPLSEGSMDLHSDPNSKAFRAAATAISTSALSASAISASTSSVAGLMTEKVFPDIESTHSLLINSFDRKQFLLNKHFYNI